MLGLSPIRLRKPNPPVSGLNHARHKGREKVVLYK
jgi:hypothetical protein